MKLPYQQTQDRQFNQYQQALADALQPLTSNPIAEAIILTGVSLNTGLNIIPTKINRNLQGWIIIRQRANVTVWDTQDVNPTPSQTLYLNTTGPTVVDIMVF